LQLSPRGAFAVVLSAALVVTVAGIELSDRTASAADPSRTRAATKPAATNAPTVAPPASTPTSRASARTAKKTKRPSTRKPTTKPTAKPPPTKPRSGGKALLGMSAPVQYWDQRVKEVGSGLQARRLFFTSFDASLSKATQACGDGMYPVISFKTGSYSWAKIAAGNADGALRALATKLTALPCDVFVAIHHEPATDGAAADWAAMQVHALPILGAGADVKVGVIGNGWWWSAGKKGYTDAQIAAYITPAVIKVSDVIAGDTYQMTASAEEAAPKITRMGAWARRVGGVRALGVGEFNAPTAAGISHATTALAADPLFAWGCLWNANLNTVTVLSGDRLTTFRKTLATW
jgi:hypothetical protein